MLDKKSFGKHVKVARKNNAMTAEQLAEKLSISSKSVWQIEGGKSATTLSGLVNICNALHVSPEYLLSGDLDCDLMELKSDYDLSGIYHPVLLFLLIQEIFVLGVRKVPGLPLTTLL